MIIFEKSQPGRFATSQVPEIIEINNNFDKNLLRESQPLLPELSELEVIRHYTQLSQKNFCIDSHFYPLGSCTMKYNPRAAHQLAMLPEFKNHHPLIQPEYAQGLMQCLYELQEYLKIITGMKAVSLTPMAGAQGEFAGCAMIKAYHRDRGDYDRIEMLISDAAHGTNPASAAMCGFKIKEIPTSAEGDIDIEVLKTLVSQKTAGIMLTNPSTLGIFERKIVEVAKIVHESGGLLYYDGANLNAILGKVKPGDMGFDVMHMNMHKTFATPHGGGGPGGGPVAVNDRLKEYLPIPIVGIRDREGQHEYFWKTQAEYPKTIGSLSTFMGNIGVLLRAYIYIRLLGEEGLHRVSEYATLNANYLMVKLKACGFELAYPNRRSTHEFIVTLAKEAKAFHVNAMEIAKRILDEGIHAPTTYFPLLIPECLLIEPTETESKQMLDHFVSVMEKLFAEIRTDPEKIKNAPSRLPCKRLDEVKAARELDLVWRSPAKARE